MSQDNSVRLIPDFVLPISFCAKCNRRFFIEDLHCLPEIREYARSTATFMQGKGAKPSEVDENVLRRKYGYNFSSMFCKECFDEVVASAKW